MTCIITVGLMRTGTSLIARQLHELGIPQGTQMRFPLMRENSQLDYEDVVFTDRCLAAVKGLIRKSRLRVFFNSYIRQRHSMGYEIWGVKSPFLYSYVELFKEEAAKLNEAVKVIVTRRDVVETFESIKRQTDSSEPTQIQQILMTCSEPQADLIVPIEESWNNPELVREKLIKLITE